MSDLTNETDDMLSMVSSAAASFAKPDPVRRKSVRDRLGGNDPDVWAEMASQGWLGVSVPEEAGGVGLGVAGAAIIAERMGYACFTEPFVAVAVVAARCIAGCPESRERARLLEGILTGKLVAALAWQSAHGDSTEVEGFRIGELIRLEGEARFIAPADADSLIVVARVDNQLMLLAIPAGTHGLLVRHEKTADGCANACVQLKSLEISISQILARDDVENILANSVEEGTLCYAAELLGLIERSVELTQSYLLSRKQFGKPIGSFQVLQHRMVDMWVQKELSRAAVQAAGEVFASAEATIDDRRVAASSAKARASHAALFIAEQAIQLHGAMGFSDEYELGLYVNRSMVLAARHGNEASHRLRYSQLAPVRER